MKHKIIIASFLASIPQVVQATTQEVASVSYYVSTNNLSVLQKLFGVATSPEVLMFVAALLIMLFAGFAYLAFGVIVFFLFRH